MKGGWRMQVMQSDSVHCWECEETPAQLKGVDLLVLSLPYEDRRWRHVCLLLMLVLHGLSFDKLSDYYQ
jgi:hypothetical protein